MRRLHEESFTLLQHKDEDHLGGQLRPLPKWSGDAIPRAGAYASGSGPRRSEEDHFSGRFCAAEDHAAARPGELRSFLPLPAGAPA